MHAKATGSTIILMGLLPRNDTMAFMPMIHDINGKLAKLADGKKVPHLNINDKVADENGTCTTGYEGRQTAPTAKAYQVWADELKPMFWKLLWTSAAD